MLSGCQVSSPFCFGGGELTLTLTLHLILIIIFVPCDQSDHLEETQAWQQRLLIAALTHLFDSSLKVGLFCRFIVSNILF